jgi:hypothetical protein
LFCDAQKDAVSGGIEKKLVSPLQGKYGSAVPCMSSMENGRVTWQEFNKKLFIGFATLATDAILLGSVHAR